MSEPGTKRNQIFGRAPLGLTGRSRSAISSGSAAGAQRSVRCGKDGLNADRLRCTDWTPGRLIGHWVSVMPVQDGMPVGPRMSMPYWAAMAVICWRSGGSLGGGKVRDWGAPSATRTRDLLLRRQIGLSAVRTFEDAGQTGT